MDPYIARAHEVVDKAEAVLEKRKGECKDCKWIKTQLLGNDYCSNPVVFLAAQTAEQGHARESIVEVDEQRRRISLWGPVVCGPDGVLFEQKESFWYWFKKWFNGEVA